MTLTAPEIHERLMQLDSDEQSDFILASDTTESDVQAWYDGIDVSKLESDADSQIERTALTDLTRGDVGPDNLSVNECIKSRNDDPNNYESAYVLRADRTFIQYFKPKVGGKEPIPESDVQTLMQAHVDDLVSKAVSAELLTRAQTEFGA